MVIQIRSVIDQSSWGKLFIRLHVPSIILTFHWVRYSYLFVHVATFAKSVAFHKWKYVLCYLIVFSIISLSCCLYLSTARPTVGAGFGRGLGQPSEGLHERARVPSGFTLWQPAGWWEAAPAISLGICFHTFITFRKLFFTISIIYPLHFLIHYIFIFSCPLISVNRFSTATCGVHVLTQCMYFLR